MQKKSLILLLFLASLLQGCFLHNDLIENKHCYLEDKPVLDLGISGKFSVNNAEHKFTASFIWNDFHPTQTIHFYSNLSNDELLLSTSDNKLTRVVTNNEEIIVEKNLEQCLSGLLAIPIPLTKIKSWLQRQASNKYSTITCAQEKFVILEDGWQISFYHNKTFNTGMGTEVSLPSKLEIANAELGIKLRIIPKQVKFAAIT